MEEKKLYYSSRAGGISRLRRKEGKNQKPKTGEALVKVKSIGLNFADIFAVEGLYSATPKGEFIPGLEFCGLVQETGKNVQHVKEGDAVMGVTRFGGYTTHLCSDACYLTPLPEGWTFEEGAAYPVQVLTAWYALIELGNLQKDQQVLIHSGAGGVGTWANRIAKWKGAKTIGTVGRSSKLAVLQEEEFTHGLVRTGNFRKELEKLLQDNPLHLVLEAIGGKVFKESYAALAPEGRLITFGAAQFSTGRKLTDYFHLLFNYLRRPRIDPLEMISDNKSVMAFNLIWLFHKAEKMEKLLKESLAAPLGKPRVGERFPFNQLPEALQHFKSGSTTGKVVINTEA